MPVRRPRYADVVGTLALVVALGGTAYAATELPRDSVGAKQIRDKAVRSPEIKDGQVRAADLAAGSVGTASFQPSAVTGAAVKDESLSLADIVGADVTGTLTFTLPGNSCGGLNIAIAGLEPGQSAFLSLIGPNPANILFGPLQVTGAGQAAARACNLDGTPFSGSVTARLVSLG